MKQHECSKCFNLQKHLVDVVLLSNHPGNNAGGLGCVYYVLVSKTSSIQFRVDENWKKQQSGFGWNAKL